MPARSLPDPPQDTIETNLLKEIGVRSSSFFEATGLIQVRQQGKEGGKQRRDLTARESFVAGWPFWLSSCPLHETGLPTPFEGGCLLLPAS